MTRAIVTGSNRGIGQRVARVLADEGLEVRGTTRDDLDLADAASIARFAGTLDAVDVLVNNAAVMLDGFDGQVARDTLAVNVVGTVALTEALLPKLGAGGRVVVVSSGMGERSGFSGAARTLLDDDTVDRDAILAAGRTFVAGAGAGTHGSEGWPSSAYSVSKALINAYVRHLARAYAGDPRGLRFVAVCPGWVRTRMGGTGAPRSVDQGADGIVWAATADEVRSGTFTRDRREIPW